MNWFFNFFRSQVGKKAVMAVSGVILFGFVLVHMAGNLKVYMGQEAFNHYAEGLRTVGAPFFARGQALWVARIVLLVAVLLHMWSAWALTLMSWRARPIAYQQRDVVAASYAARTMRWGGVIIALFVLFHLAHFTFGFSWAHPDFRPDDPYHNFVVGFQVWYVSAFYILAQVFLGLHLKHGLWSMFQSLGFDEQSRHTWRRTFATVFAVIIAAGNISFPVAVLAGLVK